LNVSMKDQVSFLEDHVSQIPALYLLQKLGYSYLTPTEALELRYSMDNVILEPVLKKQLQKLNKINYLGETYAFESSVFDRAVDAVKDFPLMGGLINTNEKIYDLLTYGTSFEQNIKGDKKSFSFRFIDWENPENNVYHVSEEFAVERVGSHETYRPDIVLFVNGIPLVIIECKRPDLKKGKDAAVGEAIQQHLRNQKEDGIPDLYKYAQILLAISHNNSRFATAGTQEEFWSYWREQYDAEDTLYRIKNTPLEDNKWNKLFSERYAYVRDYFRDIRNQEFEITDQDRALFSLCRPERLIELTYRFVLYDAGIKKIARYQQYFAVKNAMSRIRAPEEGKRTGGVIWHTQGSGKSLTMVMLAKCIALEKSIIDPRIVLVTDRVDLDDQIYGTFRNCGKGDVLVQARSGKHLKEILTRKKSSIITTIINKFHASLRKGDYRNGSPNIFVLVDESHRSQYGEANIMMQRVFPNACYIGFTGTPLMRREKNTATKFGGMIDKYTIDQAVKDKAVVPLLYEGREAVQKVNSKAIDNYFEQISESLTKQQKEDLKRKFSNADQLNQAEQKLYAIAWDVSKHYRDNWQETGFKGQLTASSKRAAIVLKKFFDEIGFVKTEVLISPPDTREGSETIYEETDNDVLIFWRNMMKRFGTPEVYNRDLINLFKNAEDPEIIIVVDKLLTGFDAPRNIVLYIARSLKEHSLLQAIARVNRLAEGKDFGFIVDYYGILENLDQAITTYTSLEGFDEDDLEGTVSSIREEINELSTRHTHVWDLFSPIKNKSDIEAYERLLANEELREDFYERVSVFSRTLKIALSSAIFHETTSIEDIEKYKKDSKFFLKLRASVKNRYSDAVDFSQYEKQIQKLIDRHVSTDEVIKLTEQVNIFDQEQFNREIEKVVGEARRADLIASRTAKHLNEKLSEDPAYYKKFSRMLQEVIDQFHQKRLSDAEYLQKVTEIKESVINRTGDDIPASLNNRDAAKAFYGTINEEIPDAMTETISDSIRSEIALKIDDIVRENMVVDWQYKENISNRIRQQIDDYLFEIKDLYEMDLDLDVIDSIIEKSLEIAKVRYK